MRTIGPDPPMSTVEQSTTRPITVSGRRALELALTLVRVTVEEGPDRGLTGQLASTSLKVGTGSTNDIQLTDPTASREHAIFFLTPAGVAIEDRDSTNGTFVNGTRIKHATVAQTGLVQIGLSILRLEVVPNRMILFPDDQAALAGLLGRSQAMRDLFALLRQLARTDLPVLVHGETGAGKDLVARAIHDLGARKSSPFLVLDCGSIVPDLLRSELFGHEKGAFTGATQTTAGILETAEGGTVFLDEIGEMELSVQPNLLRALETREIFRIGSKRPIPVNFRIVAATNKSLPKLVSEGKFREDLFYRLCGVTVRVPPLRERKEDICLLANAFAARHTERNRLPPLQISPDAMAALEGYSWPGNVRQLRNLVEAASTLSDSGVVTQKTVVDLLQAQAQTQPSISVGSLEDAEKETIRRALESTGWRRKAAARQLGIAFNTMYSKIRKYGLRPPE